MKHGRRDANHADVRDGLRKFTEVIDTAGVGNGVFDLLAHIGSDRWYWFEVKVPGKSEHDLTRDERKFMNKARSAGGRADVITTASDGLEFLRRAGWSMGGATTSLQPTISESQLRRITKPTGTVAAAHEAIGLAAKALREYGSALGESTEQRVRRLAQPNQRNYR